MHAGSLLIYFMFLLPELKMAYSFMDLTQKKILRAADKGIFAIDYSKFGKRALELTTPFKSDFMVVTNAKPEPRLNRAMRAAGTEFIITPC